MPEFTERITHVCDNILPREAGGFTIGLKTITETLRDGVVIASAPHRQVLEPGMDVSSFPDSVQAVCRALWTPSAVTAWSEAQVNAVAESTAAIAAANAKRLAELENAQAIEDLRAAFAARVAELQGAAPPQVP
ncbi:hypothetical protein [Ramlibacter sp.]|uniref:hypothetical protein n=1 Tax=Ramlibacter sp. TaxID=1917967 RepID=UPI003D0EA5C9